MYVHVYLRTCIVQTRMHDTHTFLYLLVYELPSNIGMVVGLD